MSSLSFTQASISVEVLKPNTYTRGSMYAKEMMLLANRVQSGLQARVGPIPIDDCTGGVYYLRTKNRRLTAVFKPADEEAYALNNPKQFLKAAKSSGNAGIREGISAGDAAVREVAAYLLDHQHFARVPVTMLASINHPEFHYHVAKSTYRKTGALQAYIAHRDTVDGIGASMYNAAEVHAIAVLDIRLANQDRHGGNMLVVEPTQEGNVSLVPIDHGACLPRISSLSETSFLWLFWPQAKQPFSFAVRQYIAALDAHQDLKILEDNLPAGFQLEHEAALTLHICTVLLKFCAIDLKLTAYDIGTLMIRQGTNAQQVPNPSVLEILIASSLRDPAVLESEVLSKIENKQHPALKTAARPFEKRTTDQGKAWTSYVATFMTAFRRDLVAHFSTK